MFTLAFVLHMAAILQKMLAMVDAPMHLPKIQCMAYLAGSTHRNLRRLCLLLEGGIIKEELDGHVRLFVVHVVCKHDRTLTTDSAMLRTLEPARRYKFGALSEVC